MGLLFAKRSQGQASCKTLGCSMSEADFFPAFLELIFINSILTVTFLGWKELFFFSFLLVKKVNLEEVSLSKLTILLKFFILKN